MDADLVKAAAALRWARPDLTAELADHVLDEAAATGQQDRWLSAAGWAVHARAATGDGRDTASAVLAALGQWGSDALTGAAADRLRIELAMVAAGAGEVEVARRFLAGVHADDGDPELAADLLCAHARCAVEDAPDDVAAVLDAAEAAWAMAGGAAAELGGASVALVRAVVERRAGRPATAVDHASDGLARLERGRVGSGAPSGYLAASLAAEWISALLDAGRVAEARDGCGALLPRLSEQARPTRQLALLRLTVTRVLAAQDTGQDVRADTAELLEQAAEDAAGCDVPDLEAVCRTALGALHEQAEQLEVALAALQLAVGAERRDRARSRRFLAVLAELPTEEPTDAPAEAPTEAPTEVSAEPPAEPERPRRRRQRAEPSAAAPVDPAVSADATTVLPAITRSDRKLRASREDGQERGRSRFERLFDEPAPDENEPVADEAAPTAWDAVPWNGSGGESPIGDLLIRSLRNGSAQPDEKRPDEKRPDENRTPRNGKSVGAPEHRAEESNGSSGWVPTLDAGQSGAEKPRARRRGRPADTERRRSRRAREERDDTPAEPRHVDPGGQTDDGAPRPRRRSRHGGVDGGGEGAGEAGDRAARGRHGGPAATDEPEREGRRSRSNRGGGRRRAEEEPSVTEPVPADTGSPAESADSDGWLQSALAELDRALSGIGVGKPVSLESRPSAETTEPVAGSVEEPPSDDGCAVVVDIARDGRRFAGPRASAVVRSVADLLADRLPAGARTRFGDSDALVVTGAGWSRADATDWMHRTLPGLLDGFAAAEDLPGAQLRVAVHDADGPVGAQILQPLSPTGRDRDPTEDRHREEPAEPWAALTATTSEARGQKYRAAARARQQERGTREHTEHDAEDADPGTGDAGSPKWPFSGETGQPDAGAPERPGRHGSARDDGVERSRRHRAEARDRASGERARSSTPGAQPAGSGRAARRRGDEAAASTASNGNGSNGNGSRGNGSRSNGSHTNGSANGTATVTEPATTSDGGEPARTESTEGLGIADLLAGALAAYRGI
ncbi:hypothetical protein [Pseudonocardia sp. DLS-67]